MSDSSGGSLSYRGILSQVGNGIDVIFTELNPILTKVNDKLLSDEKMAPAVMKTFAADERKCHRDYYQRKRNLFELFYRELLTVCQKEGIHSSPYDLWVASEKKYFNRWLESFSQERLFNGDHRDRCEADERVKAWWGEHFETHQSSASLSAIMRFGFDGQPCHWDLFWVYQMAAMLRDGYGLSKEKPSDSNDPLVLPKVLPGPDSSDNPLITIFHQHLNDKTAEISQVREGQKDKIFRAIRQGDMVLLRQASCAYLQCRDLDLESIISSQLMYLRGVVDEQKEAEVLAEALGNAKALSGPSLEVSSVLPVRVDPDGREFNIETSLAWCPDGFTVEAMRADGFTVDQLRAAGYREDDLTGGELVSADTAAPCDEHSERQAANSELALIKQIHAALFFIAHDGYDAGPPKVAAIQDTVRHVNAAVSKHAFGRGCIDNKFRDVVTREDLEASQQIVLDWLPGVMTQVDDRIMPLEGTLPDGIRGDSVWPFMVSAARNGRIASLAMLSTYRMAQGQWPLTKQESAELSCALQSCVLAPGETDIWLKHPRLGLECAAISDQLRAMDPLYKKARNDVEVDQIMRWLHVTMPSEDNTVEIQSSRHRIALPALFSVLETTFSGNPNKMAMLAVLRVCNVDLLVKDNPTITPAVLLNTRRFLYRLLCAGLATDDVFSVVLSADQSSYQLRLAVEDYGDFKALMQAIDLLIMPLKDDVATVNAVISVIAERVKTQGCPLLGLLAPTSLPANMLSRSIYDQTVVLIKNGMVAYKTLPDCLAPACKHPYHNIAIRAKQAFVALAGSAAIDKIQQNTKQSKVQPPSKAGFFRRCVNNLEQVSASARALAVKAGGSGV
jgi:hypothetical protein